MKNLIKRISKLVLKIRVDNAIKKANAMQAKTKMKHLVIMFNKKPIVISKQQINKLVKLRKFKKGTTVQDIEKQAIYITL